MEVRKKEGHFPDFDTRHTKPDTRKVNNMTREAYNDFDATELYCPKCKRAMPVKKRLLLILSNGDKYDYTCAYCGTSLGDKMDSKKDNFSLFIK
jgi:RecJ-like exonuclease